MELYSCGTSFGHTLGTVRRRIETRRVIGLVFPYSMYWEHDGSVC